MAWTRIKGVKVYYRKNSTDDVVINEVFNKDPYYVDEIPKSSIVLDIGAHIGTFALRCAHERDCTVYSYEPCKSSYDLLVKNVHVNKLEDNIKTFNLAVAGKSGLRKLCVDQHHYAGSSFYENLMGDGQHYLLAVKCVTLRQIFKDNKIKYCDVLKLDCEGEEKHILFSSERLFKRVGMMMLEYHTLSDGMEIAYFLESRGFTARSSNDFKYERAMLYVRMK